MEYVFFGHLLLPYTVISLDKIICIRKNIKCVSFIFFFFSYNLNKSYKKYITLSIVLLRLIFIQEVRIRSTRGTYLLINKWYSSIVTWKYLSNIILTYITNGTNNNNNINNNIYSYLCINHYGIRRYRKHLFSYKTKPIAVSC